MVSEFLRESPKDSDQLVNDLGLDSLDGIELVIAIEEEFLVDISDESLGEFYIKHPQVTIADVIGAIMHLQTPKAA